MQLTTTRLQLPSPRRWLDIPAPIAAAIVTFCLIAIAALVGRIEQAQPPAIVVPTPALPVAPIIVIQKERAVIAPALATPDMQMRAEIEQLRDRLAALEAERQAQPAVEPIQEQTTGEVPAAPILAPAQQDIQVDNAQPAAPQPAQQAQPAPTVAPAPAQPTAPVNISVDGLSAAEQWRQEHCLTPSGPCQ